MRPHMWYFAFDDCYNELPENNLVIEYEMYAENTDGSHFSYEQKGLWF